MNTHHCNITITFHPTRVPLCNNVALYSYVQFSRYVYRESLTRGIVAQTAVYISNVGSWIGVTPPPHNPAQPAQSVQNISIDQKPMIMVLKRKERYHEPERIPGCQEPLAVDHVPASKQEKANVQEEQVDEENP